MVICLYRVDCLPTQWGGGKLLEIRDILSHHECKFGNLEVPVLNKDEGYPELFPGGSYGLASPECLDDIKKLGFNLLNSATNHAMDFGHGGLLKTMENCKRVGIPVAGIGKNLSEASSPVFCECENGRVALIGVTSSFHDSYAAGPQNQDFVGRPGVAPLKHRAIYSLKPDDYETLVRIAGETGINAYQNAGIKLGYVVQSDIFKFGTFEFIKSNVNECHTYPDKQDLDRTIKVVRDAKIQADIVIVSVHSHQVNKSNADLNSEFVSIFAKNCIDAGADMVVCHGPHSLRGIEKYGRGIIFHGLGNMIFQTDQQLFVPEEFYQKYGTTRQESDGVGTINLKRNNNNTRGFITTNKQWRSVITSMECNNDAFDLMFYPIEISKQSGLPALSSDVTILEDFNNLCKMYNTEIKIKDTIGYMNLSRS